MSRALVPGLANPFPLGSYLPAVFREPDMSGEDEFQFIQRWTAALDEVLAPVFTSLDNLEYYIDPQIAPEDYLGWLATWVGLVLEEPWSPQRRRAIVAEASRLYQMRGTAKGLRAHLELLTSGQVEIEETGGTSWSTRSGNELPGRPGFGLVVRVHMDDPNRVDEAWLDALVATAKPAHVEHRLELIGPGSSEPRSGPEPPSTPSDPQQHRSEHGSATRRRITAS